MVVITILGILAAFAVPKFIALDSQARIATINGLARHCEERRRAGPRHGHGDEAGTIGPVTMEGADGQRW